MPQDQVLQEQLQQLQRSADLLRTTSDVLCTGCVVLCTVGPFVLRAGGLGRHGSPGAC